MSSTYKHSKLLAQSWSHKTQDQSTDGDSCPEPRGNHTRFELATRALAAHEGDNPTTQSDFGTDISEQEYGSNPGNAALECCSKTTFAWSI